MIPLPLHESEPSIRLEGAPVHVKIWDPRTRRNAAPILLIHDSLGSVALWRSFPAALARETGRKVIAYDRPGFGRSAPRSDVMPRDFVQNEGERVIPALLKALAVDEFIVVGHSVGGGMAVWAGAAAGARCKAVVTIGTQACVDAQILAGVRAAGEDLRRPGGLDRLLRHHGDKSAWVVASWVDRWLAPEFADYTLDEPAARILAPLLAIHGEADEYGSTDHARRIAAHAPNARSLIMPGWGHVPHREHGVELAALIGAFLEETLGA